MLSPIIFEAFYNSITPILSLSNDYDKGGGVEWNPPHLNPLPPSQERRLTRLGCWRLDPVSWHGMGMENGPRGDWWGGAVSFPQSFEDIFNIDTERANNVITGIL